MLCYIRLHVCYCAFGVAANFTLLSLGCKAKSIHFSLAHYLVQDTTDINLKDGYLKFRHQSHSSQNVILPCAWKNG